MTSIPRVFSLLALLLQHHTQESPLLLPQIHTHHHTQAPPKTPHTSNNIVLHECYIIASEREFWRTPLILQFLLRSAKTTTWRPPAFQVLIGGFLCDGELWFGSLRFHHLTSSVFSLVGQLNLYIHL